MAYKSDIAKYIEKGMEQGSHKTRKEYIEILLRNKLLAPITDLREFQSSLT